MLRRRWGSGQEIAVAGAGTTLTGDRPSPLIDSAAGRGLAVYRLLALTYSTAVVVAHRDEVVRWWPAVAYGLVVLGWSVLAPLLPRPTPRAIVVELAIAVGGIFLTDLVYDEAQVVVGIQTVPGVWSASPVLAAALLAGVRGGLLAALVVATANVLQTQDHHLLMWHNIVLLLLLGGLVGLCVQLARESQTRLEAAIAASEQLAERERLSRQVHDGVLQVLALVHRRGRDLEEPGPALATLAAEQERALRTFITRVETGAVSPLRLTEGASGGDDRGGAAPEALVDLRDLLARRSGATVEVALPPEPVPLPSEVALELDAAVGAALDNVEQHAGEDASAWVLVDLDDDQLEVLIRDDGAGLAPGRLVEAAGEGRLGASSSIRGRLRDLGGDAAWRSPGTGGCTVTLTVPLPVSLPVPVTTSASR